MKVQCKTALNRLLSGVSCLLLFAGTIQAQDRSPVGDWNCVISGSRSGLAYLSFSSVSNGGSFQGFELIVPKNLPPARASISNAVAGTLATSAQTGRSTTSPSRTNLIFFGGFPVSGPWRFDRHETIVGSFLEIAPDRITCRTNVTPFSTNLFVSPGAIAETNLSLSTVCVTSPMLTNMVPGTYQEQTICYMNHIAISTNFSSSIEIVNVTNLFPNGTCETFFLTNIDSQHFEEETICYVDRVPFSTNFFQSLLPMAQTNALPFGLCETFITSTNFIAGTFINQTICFTNELNCTGVTNIVNFTAKATPGKRLALTAKSPFGNFTIKGVPSTPLTDLSGPWAGTKKVDGSPAFEFFELAPVTNIPNAYFVAGQGPSYIYDGIAFLSAQKKIAFGLTLLSGADYKSTRAVQGSFNSKKLTSKTSGIDAPGGAGALTNRTTFQVEKRFSVP